MTFRKDPEAVLDYDTDWTKWLDGDTIASSTWFPADKDGLLVIDSHTFTDTAAKVWLSGGTLGVLYSLTNRITTAGGRTNDDTIKVRIVER